MAHLSIPSSQILQLIHLHLLSNGLSRTSQLLQEESSVGLPGSTVNLSVLTNVGRWGDVLTSLNRLDAEVYDAIPATLIAEIKEMTILELSEADPNLSMQIYDRLIDDDLQPVDGKDDKDFEKKSIFTTKSINRMRDSFTSSVKFSDSGETRDQRRARIGEELEIYVKTAQDDKLLMLLRQSLLWQVHTNTLPKALETKITREGEEEQTEDLGKYNIATGSVSTSIATTTTTTVTNTSGCVKELKGVVKLSKYSNPLSFAYIASPPCVVTGGDDGLIELWDADSCKLFQNAYQSTERFMSHTEGVTALANSPDYEMLASADTSGTIKVWSVSTGQCVRKFEGVFNETILAITFTQDSSGIVAGSKTGNVKKLGLNSGNVLTEYAGLETYVNAVIVHEGRVVAGSEDGIVKVWNEQNGVEMKELEDKADRKIESGGVKRLIEGKGGVLVVRKGTTAKMFDWESKVTKTFKAEGLSEFEDGALSGNEKFFYGLTNDKGQNGAVTAYEFETTKFERRVEGRGHVDEILSLGNKNELMARGKEGKRHKVFLWS